MCWIPAKTTKNNLLYKFAANSTLKRARKPPGRSQGLEFGVDFVSKGWGGRFRRAFGTSLGLFGSNPSGSVDMAGTSSSFSGNMKKALAGLRHINLEGLRWRVFDAKGQVLGRLASQISTVLEGKDKPTYAPHRDDGDMCIVLNAKDICVTGKKLTDKFYRWHTGYVGNLKERSLKDQMAKDPTEVIRKAVLRMLSRNKLRDDRDRKLRIFAGAEHPFGDRPVEPYIMPPRQVREMRPRARRAIIRAQKRAEQRQGAATMKKKGKEEEKRLSSS